MSIPAIVTVCSEVARHVARGAVHGPFRGIRRHVSHVSHRAAHHVPRHIIPARLEIVCHAIGAGLMGVGVASLGMTAGTALAPPPALVADAGTAGTTGQYAAVSAQGGGATAPFPGADVFGDLGQPPGLAPPVPQPQDFGLAPSLPTITPPPLPPEALPHPPPDLGSPEPFPPPPAPPPPPPPRGDIPEPAMGLVLLAAAGAGWAVRRLWVRPARPVAGGVPPSSDP